MRPFSKQLDAPGVHFGRYRVLSRLAKGGMAELFLAKQVGLGGISKSVVLKCILPHLADQQEFVTMFLDEARLTAQLDHPNIVQVYEIDHVEGIYFIAMEYIRGQSLRSFCLKLYKHPEFAAAPPYGLLAEIGAQAALGLDFAHNAVDGAGNPLQIVHRDTSPSNLLLSYTGQVKIIDFGVAKANSQVHQTRVGVLKGRLSHMAPEQLTGLPADQRSDLFSLGIVLYELCTQRSLFQRDTEGEIIQALLSDSIVPPSAFIPGFPPALEAIIMKTLEREPDERYQSAKELHLDLQAFARANPYPQGLALADVMQELFAKEQSNAQLESSSGTIDLNELSLFLRNTGVHALPTTGSPSGAFPGPGSGSSFSQAGMQSYPPPQTSRWLWAFLMLLLVLVGAAYGAYFYGLIPFAKQAAPQPSELSLVQQLLTERSWLKAAVALDQYALHAPNEKKAWIAQARQKIQVGLKVDLAEKLYQQGRYEMSRSMFQKLVDAHTRDGLFRLSVRARYLDGLLQQVKSLEPRKAPVALVLPRRTEPIVPPVRPRSRWSRRKLRYRRRRREPIKRARKAATGLVYINVSPTAKVLLDGAMLGFTPINRKSVPIGEHRVELRANGHLSVTRDITVSAEQPLILNLQLEKIPTPRRIEPRVEPPLPPLRRKRNVAAVPTPSPFLPFARVQLPRRQKVRIYFTDPRGIAQRVFNPRALQQLFRQIEREVSRLAKDRSKTQGITRSWANYLKRTFEQKQDDFVTIYPRASAYVIYRDLQRNRSKSRIGQILILYQKRNRFRRYLSR